MHSCWSHMDFQKKRLFAVGKFKDTSMLVGALGFVPKLSLPPLCPSNGSSAYQFSGVDFHTALFAPVIHTSVKPASKWTSTKCITHNLSIHVTFWVIRRKGFKSFLFHYTMHVCILLNFALDSKGHNKTNLNSDQSRHFGCHSYDTDAQVDVTCTVPILQCLHTCDLRTRTLIFGLLGAKRTCLIFD